MPIAPPWLGYFPELFWGACALLFPYLYFFNKPVRPCLVPPLGPSFSATGDVSKSAQNKGWIMSWFPYFLLASACVGMGSTAPFGNEPVLRKFLVFFVLPFSLATIQLHAIINFRRLKGLHCGDAFTVMVCVSFQLLFLAGHSVWTYFSLLASQPGGTLEATATRVHLSVYLSLGVVVIICISAVWRINALVYAWMRRARLASGTATLRVLWEEYYLGAKELERSDLKSGKRSAKDMQLL